MIKILQLVTAQEIIGEVTEQDNAYSVKDPATIHLVPQGQGSSFGVGLIPFMPYVNGAVIINKDKVVIEAEPTVEMRNNYNKMFGSGIQIANVMPK
jgi:hypothetical protein